MESIMSPSLADGIIKWSQMDIDQVDLNYKSNLEKNFESSPFAIDPVINSRVALWHGDVLSLCVDGITAPTNETISELPQGVIQRTGEGYLIETRDTLRSIRTGEARLAPSHPNLPCRHLILTVCPRYSDKYKTAAETALFSCYNSILEKASERNMEVVAIPPLHLSGKAIFPDELGANVAIRTVRRFLEKGYTQPQLIVLAISDPVLFRLYQSLMVGYFPRESAHEDYACVRLPLEIGDEEGAPWLPDRRIRIFSNPAENPESVEEDQSILEDLNRDFVKMQDDVDKERLLHDGSRRRRTLSNLNDMERHIAIEIETKERSERILRRARTEDLSAISKTGCLYRSGQDRLGRQVIVVVGKWFRPESMDLDKAFLYLVKMLDEINGEYSVIYFHTSTGPENRPSFRWMRAVYDNMEYRFKKNLKSLCIVHPTLWTKVLTWWFTTFMAPAIKAKVQNVAGLQELYAVIDPNNLQIPAFITEHDITLYGFGAVAYSHNHSLAGSLAGTPTTPVK